MNIDELLEKHLNVTLRKESTWYIGHDRIEGGYKMRYKATNENVPSDMEGNLHTKILNAILMSEWEEYIVLPPIRAAL